MVSTNVSYYCNPTHTVVKCCVTFTCANCHVRILLCSTTALHLQHAAYVILQTVSILQVLSEVTLARKRRKQARPAKAAGDIVPAVLPESHNLTSHTPHSPNSNSTPPSAPPLSIQPPDASSDSRPSSAGTTSSQSLHSSSKRRKCSSTDAKQLVTPLQVCTSSPVQLASPPSAAALASSNPFSSSTLPFNYSSLYQNNVSGLFSAQANCVSHAQAQQLLAQAYTAATAVSANPLMAINNSFMLNRGLSTATGYQPKVNVKSSHPKPTLITAKKEPKVPLFTYPTSAVSRYIIAYVARLECSK